MKTDEWPHEGCAYCGGTKMVGVEPWHVYVPCFATKETSETLHELNRVDPPEKRWERALAQHRACKG